MTVFRGHLLGVGQWVQIEARGEDASNRTVSSASASSASSSTRFKLSVPVIIGIVAVALILLGFGVLIWRWRVRVREVARMNRSYEKYGVGRGIESSNSYSTGGSTSKSSKADPYGSFFEVETEKPKKALLNFRRSSTLTSGSTSHGGHAKQGSGWNAPSSWQRQSKTAAVPPVPTQPPGLGGNTGKSMASSFSFSLKKSEEKKAPLKPQHLPNSIKSKGISAPLIVANGGPEPLWSPPITTTSNFEQQPQASSLSLLAQPQPPPPASTSTTPSSFPQKLKQPQPRSPPATPGTSQKQDLLAVSRDARRFSNGGAFTSDGSLYSRNSFSSSNHDHSVPPPPPPAATPPPPSLERDVLPPPAINSGPSTSGSGNSGTVKSQQRNKSGNGSGKGHTANQSSSYTYKRRESSTTATSGITGHQGSNSPYHQPTGGYGSQNQSHPHHHSQLPRLMTVIAPFTPTLEDELPLKVGDTVRIIEEYRDAWCLVQLVGRIDSPRGVVPCVCLQERKRIIPVPMNV